MGVSTGEEYPHHSPTFARGVKPYGQHRVLDNEGPVGLEAGPSNIPPYRSAMRYSIGGLVGLQADTSVPSLLQLAVRSYAPAMDAFL